MMKLQDGVTESSVHSSVLKIGERFSYGISCVDADALNDESESCLWCWETRDLALFPSHLCSSLRVRRAARKLIHERIVDLSGKLAAKDSPSANSDQNSEAVGGEVLNLDGIRSFVEELKQNNDADITKMQGKTKAMKVQKMLGSQVIKEVNKKDRELKHMKEKAEKDAKRIERENKRLEKHKKELEKEKKRREKEQVELKMQASLQRQAKIMESFLKRKTNSNTETSGRHYSLKTACLKPSGNIEEQSVAATSAMDCALSQADCLPWEELRKGHVYRWNELKRSQHNRLLQRWGVRRSPKIQLFHELKLLKSPAIAPSGNMSTPRKEQLTQENPGSLDFTKLLDELKTPSHENNVPSKTAQSSTSSVSSVKKLLQFDSSHRPAYYGTWRKSFKVSAKQPFERYLELNYDVESDEEWVEEDPGERLSDFEKDDETMNEHDFQIDAEEETENSFAVPNDYLSEDEGVQCEPRSDKFNDACSIVSTPGVTIEELNVLLQRQKALHLLTENALRKDIPLIISNLDHRKLDSKDEDTTAIPKVEKLCLQALCMKKYPQGPIIDVPVVNVSLVDKAFCQTNKKSPKTPVPSKSISDSDMLEIVKLITSCSQGMSKLVELSHERFPCYSKAQLKNKVREIAEYTNNRWQVTKDILDRYGFSLSSDKAGSPKCAASLFSERHQPLEESGKSAEYSSPRTILKHQQQSVAQEPGGSAPESDH